MRLWGAAGETKAKLHMMSASALGPWPAASSKSWVSQRHHCTPNTLPRSHHSLPQLLSSGLKDFRCDSAPVPVPSTVPPLPNFPRSPTLSSTPFFYQACPPIPGPALQFTFYPPTLPLQPWGPSEPPGSSRTLFRGPNI